MARLYIFKAIHAFKRIWSGHVIPILSLREIFYNLVSCWVMLLQELISGGPGLSFWEKWLMAPEQSQDSQGFWSDKYAPKEAGFLGLTNNKTSPREAGSLRIIKIIWSRHDVDPARPLLYLFVCLHDTALLLIYWSLSYQPVSPT